MRFAHYHINEHSPASSLMSPDVAETLTESHLWRKGFIHFHAIVHSKVSQDRKSSMNQEAGTRAEAWNVAYGLALHGLFSLLPCTTQDYQLSCGTTHSGLGLTASIKKMPHRLIGLQVFKPSTLKVEVGEQNRPDCFIYIVSSRLAERQTLSHKQIK